MILVNITYKKPLDVIDEHLGAHREYLKKYYESGHFIVSGPKEPRVGGVILSLGTQQEVEAILKLDPFQINDVADYELTEFHGVLSCDELKEKLGN